MSRAGTSGSSRRKPGVGPRVRPADGSSPSSGVRQVSLARLGEFGVTPKRDLGQNFLIDDNILGVILGQLECSSEDVVLEVGAGLGVLTKALAGVARHVHAFEVDRSLEGPLKATLGDLANLTVHFEDILRASLEELAPRPTLCASNLPYSVAGPFVVEALQRLPSVRRYCLMVQREVAERMAAPPGSKTYGGLSVWVHLYTRIVRVRPLSRSIFYPRPRVDSSLIVLDRLPAHDRPPSDAGWLRVVVQAAFGQRRKTLANAMASGLGLGREQVLSCLSSLGLPSAVRAEQVTPAQLAALADLLRGLEPPG